MAESPKLPEQYHRSRLTTLVASTVLFLISLQSPKFLSGFLPFGLRLPNNDYPFFVVALTIYAFISLVSLHLIYNDEVRGYIRLRQSKDQLSDIAELSQRAKQALDDFQASSSATLQDLQAVDIDALLIRSTAEIRPDALEGLIKAAFADLPIERLSGIALQLEIYAESGAPMDERARDNLRAVAGLTGEVAYWQENVANNLMERGRDGSWSRQTLGRLLTEQLANFTRSVDSLQSLAKDLDEYVYDIKRGSLVRRMEYQIIGVWIPTVLFTIALIHALGAIFGGALNTLPFYVTKLLGLLR